MYLINYKGCVECGRKEMLASSEKQVEDDGTEESIEFRHECATCRHVVATHKYTFSVDGDYQEHTMECLLCGCGDATASVEPVDPRKVGGEVF